MTEEEKKIVDESNAATNIFDLINQSEKFGTNKIDIIICNNDPWFKGKDIAKILGYNNTNDAIKDNVDKEDKQSLSDILKVLAASAYPKYNQNQLKTIYINESGLYSLILNSKLPSAKKFKKWVTGDLLPKVRKLGQEKYLEQLKHSQLLLAEKDQQLREAEERAEHQKRGMDQIRQFIENSKVREMNEKIYIAFCPLDAKQNIFKVGGCQSAALLKTRLSTYNSPQSNDNLYAFAAVWNCHKFAEVENRIKQIIGEFRQDGKKEVYLMHIYSTFILKH